MNRRFAAALLALIVLLGGSSSVAVQARSAPDAALTVPEAAGPPSAVTTEIGYDAFPWAVRDSAGRAWVAYSHSSSHVATGGEIRLRHADGAQSWSAPITLVAGDPSYGTGVGGFVADPVHNRLWLAIVRNQPLTSSTATNYVTTTRYLDLATGEWSTPTPLPQISPTQNVGSGLVVRPDGLVLASAYGTPTGATFTAARVSAYDQSTNTWSTLSTLALATRNVQEPTMFNLADGRLGMLFRSDGAAPYYDYLYAAVSPDSGATWDTPYRIVTHGSGLPNAFLRPDGQIAVTYRGFSEPKNPPAALPPRVAMLTPAGVAADSAIDVLGGVTARYLYGEILPGTSTEPDRWVYSLEGPNGQAGSGAAVYSVPLKWTNRSG